MRAVSWLALGLVLLAVRAVAAEPVEPPPEAVEGVDYEAEAGDSIETGSVETSLGASGRPGDRPRGRRRVRFSDASFSGDAREGQGDPLAGGSVEGRGRGGRWTVGRLGVAWGRGLVAGGPLEPWRAGLAGDGAAPGVRGGQGVRWQPGALELLAGRFAGRDLAGARVARGGIALGLVAARSGQPQASTSIERGDLSTELALDRTGRWRAEAGIERDLGAIALSARARGGQREFRPLAAPARAGPAQALTIRLARGPGGDGARVALIGALWRFRPGLAGGRAALEFATRMPHHATLSAGLEEQHGVRRETSAHPERWRQGAWAEWRGGSRAFGLLLSQELWGERAFARRAVRSVSAAGVEVTGPWESRLRVAHCVYRVRRGETLYLPEAESDRLVLRALSGNGERTRVELQTPLAGGVVRAAASLATPARRSPRLQWTATWTRRASFRRSR